MSDMWDMTDRETYDCIALAVDYASMEPDAQMTRDQYNQCMNYLSTRRPVENVHDFTMKYPRIWYGICIVLGFIGSQILVVIIK